MLDIVRLHVCVRLASRPAILVVLKPTAATYDHGDLAACILVSPIMAMGDNNDSIISLSESRLIAVIVLNLLVKIR